jgi:hypothetical protein
VFLTAASGLLPAGARFGRLHRAEYELPRPWLLAGLVMAAAISGAVGRFLQSREAPELVATALQNGIPQVLLLIVIGRLAAALILS